MSTSVYHLIIFLSFLISLTVYLRPRAEKYLLLFPLFLLITLVVEYLGTYLMDQKISNVFVYNLFTVIEFVFYFWILREIVRGEKAKKMILIVLWLYPLLALFNIIFIQKIDHLHTITYGLGCLIIVAVCTYYFYELFQTTDSANLLREPAFWICSGLLFFYCCSFPIFGPVNIMANAPRIIWNNFSVILQFLNSLLYFSFAAAFLCRLRLKNIAP